MLKEKREKLNSMCEVLWSIKWKIRGLTLGPMTSSSVLFGPLCSVLLLSVLSVYLYKWLLCNDEKCWNTFLREIVKPPPDCKAGYVFWIWSCLGAVLHVEVQWIRKAVDHEISLRPFQILQSVKHDTKLNQVRNLSSHWELKRYYLPFPPQKNPT